ncbi:Protein CLEC-52, partial [Aphelenchoides avenae]
MNLAGKWISDNCANTRAYLCEISEGATTCNPQMCDSGWTYFKLTGFCYKVIHQNLTFDEAEGECGKEGAHLASIHSNGENTMLA